MEEDDGLLNMRVLHPLSHAVIVFGKCMQTKSLDVLKRHIGAWECDYEAKA